MADIILPEKPADRWSLSDWQEMMAQNRPSGAGTFSSATSEDSLEILVKFNQVRSCLQQILGWAWADDAAPYLLHRESVPVQHPYFPWLWADAARVEPFNPLGKTQTDLTIKAKELGVAFPDYGPEYFTRYTLAKITIRFVNINWQQWLDSDPIWADNFVGEEWGRSFGLANKTTTLDLITAEGGNDAASLYFAEGNTSGAGTGPVTGPNGTPFGGTQFIRVNRTDYKMLWKCVPLNYFAGPTSFTAGDEASYLMPSATRMMKALGRVNSAPFPGANSPFVAGTLLLKAVEEVPYQQPVRTTTEFGLFASDFYLTFEHFDPTRDATAVTNPSGTTPVKRGHYLFPYRPTGKWYYATAGTETTRGTYGGTAPIQSQDFHDLFRHVGNPAYPLPTD